MAWATVSSLPHRATAAPAPGHAPENVKLQVGEHEMMTINTTYVH